MNRRTAVTIVGFGLAGSIFGLGAKEAVSLLEKDPYVELVNATKCSDQLGGIATTVTVLPYDCANYTFNRHEDNTYYYDGFDDTGGVSDLNTTYDLPSAEEFLDSESARIASSRDGLRQDLEPAFIALGGLLGTAIGIKKQAEKTKANRPNETY